MTSPYMAGTVSVTAGSAVVTGSGTAWQTALVAGGLFGLDSSNGNPVPILSVDSDTQLTLAKPWRGTTAAGQAYWIIRDTAYLQQLITNAQALATYIQRLDNAALATLAGLTPAADKVAYFTGAGSAALASLTAQARQLLDDTSFAQMLTTLGAAPAGGVTGSFSVGGTLSAGVLMELSGNWQLNGNRDDISPDVFALRCIAPGQSGNANVLSAFTNGIIRFGNTVTPGSDNSTVGMQWNINESLRIATGVVPIIANKVGGDGSIMSIRNGGSTVGGISVSGGTTSFLTSSDWRLKTDVSPLVDFTLSDEAFYLLDNSLLSVMALRPVSFRWLGNEEGGLQRGFIAHEMQQIMPHAVTGAKDAVEDIGTAVVPARTVPARTTPPQPVTVTDPETGEAVLMWTPEREVPEQHYPEEVYDGITELEAPPGSIWTKTGERSVYQGVDHSKLVADLVAAFQSSVIMLLEQREIIQGLADRVTALELAE